MRIPLRRRKRKNKFIGANGTSEQAGSGISDWKGVVREDQLTDARLDDTMKSKEKLVYSIDQEGILKRILIKKKKKRDERYPVDFKYLNVGYYIITPILMGVFVGLAIDIWLGTRPVFVMLGLTGGTVAVFYNLFTFLRHGERPAHQHKT